MSKTALQKIADPIDDQVKVKVYDGAKNYSSPEIEEVPDLDSDEALVALESESGVEGYMIMPKRSEYEVSSGIYDVDSMEEFCRIDSLVGWKDQPENFMPDDSNWDKDYDKQVWHISTPSQEKIDEFGERHQEKLEEASNNEEERDALREIWEKAADFEPEEKERFG